MNNNDVEALEVVIVSVGRSGSSLVADVVATNKDSAYIFEPLWYVHKDRDNPVNSTVALEILHDVFNCNYE